MKGVKNGVYFGKVISENKKEIRIKLDSGKVIRITLSNQLDI